jgi:hypothetical protein
MAACSAFMPREFHHIAIVRLRASSVPQNGEVLRDLKFGIGDGQLHFYLYNWRLTSPLAPSQVGLILM